MGWRFRRSVKVAPGVRLNFGKRSAGVSIGPRGAKLSVNTKGQYGKSVGLPGTGLSFQKRGRLGKGSSESERPEAAVEPSSRDVLHMRRRRVRRPVGWSGAAAIVLLAVAGAPALAGYLVLPVIIAVLVAPRFVR